MPLWGVGPKSGATVYAWQVSQHPSEVLQACPPMPRTSQIYRLGHPVDSLNFPEFLKTMSPKKGVHKVRGC